MTYSGWGTTYEDSTLVDTDTAFDALTGANMPKDVDAMMFQLLAAIAKNTGRIADSLRRMEER